MWATNEAGKPSHGQVVRDLTGLYGYADGNALEIEPDGTLRPLAGIRGIDKDFARLHPDLKTPKFWSLASEPQVDAIPVVTHPLPSGKSDFSKRQGYAL
jgi:hypothetical protein